MPEHGAPEMMYVEGFEEGFPAIHPLISRGVQDKGREASLILAAGTLLQRAAVPLVFQGHFPAVLLDPMIPLVFIIGEKGRRTVFA